MGTHRGFALHPGTTNRYEIRYAKTQHRPPSRQVNDHGRVSGTHTVALNESTQEWLLLDIADASDPVVCSDMLKDPRLELPAQLRQKILRLATP